ncbi:MAG: LURP-one-related family protein [Planctomycetota bacterium]
MGRYRLAQRWFAFGDDFAVEDEDGREAFFVDGRAFSWGKKLSVEAPRGREVAFIAQRLLTWGPTYEITRDGVLAAVVKKQLFTFFRCRFAVDVPGPDDLEAVGDFLDHEYELVRGGDVVATVSKAWWSWTDSYGVDVADGEDDVLAICVAVVIDLCCHQPR